MYSGAKAIRCLNKHCSEYQVRYEYPSIQLRRIGETALSLDEKVSNDKEKAAAGVLGQ